MVNKSKNMIELYPLGKNKDIIYDALIESQNIRDIVSGIVNSTADIKNNIYRQLIIDTTQLEAKTYITMDTELENVKNENTKCILLIIDVFTSLTLTNLSPQEQAKFYSQGFYGNRIDVLIDMIKRLISETNIGIGATTLKPSRPVTIIQPTEKYYGKRMVFHIYDF